ncbi:MAG: hypothetical protein NVSMB1_14760 [Polyangiales bacterium]
MAHELRNALSVLETSLHMVRRTLENHSGLPPNVDVHLKRMAEQVHAGQAIVREVLDEGRDAVVERDEVDLRTMVMEVVAGVVRPAGVKVDVDVPQRRVSIDPRQTRQLLLNLVRNAVEAIALQEQVGSEPGLVRVIAKVIDDGLMIEVHDNGPGVDEAIAPRLFQAFASGKSGGTGLGLVVCRRIAQAHGGDISVRNIEPHGTAFVVRLHLFDANVA